MGTNNQPMQLKAGKPWWSNMYYYYYHYYYT